MPNLRRGHNITGYYHRADPRKAIPLNPKPTGVHEKVSATPASLEVSFRVIQPRYHADASFVVYNISSAEE